jgi:hypothetical protein
MGRGAPKRVQPERRPEGIDRWAGLWVAVLNGKVIAAAESSGELVASVRSKGPSAAGAVAQYGPRRTEDIVIGVG